MKIASPKTVPLKIELPKGRRYLEDETAITIAPLDLKRRLEKHDKINVVDVREEVYFHQGHIPGAHNLPHTQWENGKPLCRDRVNIFYGYSDTCHLAATAAELFTRKGFQVLEMEGGFNGWKENQLPIEK